MVRGHSTDTQTNRRTCRLSDQLGPEGRVGEKVEGFVIKKRQLKPTASKKVWKTQQDTIVRKSCHIGHNARPEMKSHKCIAIVPPSPHLLIKCDLSNFCCCGASLWVVCYRQGLPSDILKADFLCAVKTLVLKFCTRKNAKKSLKIT